MPDDLMRRPPEDREWINVDEIHDLRDWAIYFSVSKDRIREAVAVVGPKVDDVKQYLGK